MRLFLAINFSAEIKAAIANARDALKGAAVRGSFTFDENLHLTLVFLGECDGRQAETVKAVMDGVAFNPFTLALGKVGCFKRDGSDTWWIGLKDNPALSALQSDLTERLRRAGFAIEARKYTPHITLGREVKLLAGFIPPQAPQTAFEVKSIELMKSERINGRLTYTSIYTKSI